MLSWLFWWRSGVPCKAQDRLPHRCRTELPGIQPAPSAGHISTILIHFHLLMIKLCISDKILLLTYKSLSVLFYQTSRFIMSWISGSSETSLFITQHTGLRFFGDRAIWNSLLAEINQMAPLHSLLLTCLFTKVYGLSQSCQLPWSLELSSLLLCLLLQGVHHHPHQQKTRITGLNDHRPITLTSDKKPLTTFCCPTWEPSLAYS